LLPRVIIAENRFGVDAELIAKFARLRCRIKEVGIKYTARTYAEGKKVRWKDGLRAVYVIVKYGLFHRASYGTPVSPLQEDARFSLIDQRSAKS
jgi:hypothetical protein